MTNPDPASATAPRPTRLIVLTAAFTLVIAACVVSIAFVLASRTDGSESFGDRVGSVLEGSESADERSEREAAMRQAQQFVLRVNTYGPGDLDAQNTLPDYAERVTEVITTKFNADFERVGLPLAQSTVAQSGYARSAQVFAAGVAAIDVDSATVLVAGSFTGSYPDPQDPEQRIEVEALPFRYEVSMVKTEGSWLVDEFLPAGSDGDAVGEAPGLEQPEIEPNQPLPSAPAPAPGPSAGVGDEGSTP